jgi:hypothetical protein
MSPYDELVLTSKPVAYLPLDSKAALTGDRGCVYPVTQALARGAPG